MSERRNPPFVRPWVDKSEATEPTPPPAPPTVQIPPPSATPAQASTTTPIKGLEGVVAKLDMTTSTPKGSQPQDVGKDVKKAEENAVFKNLTQLEQEVLLRFLRKTQPVREVIHRLIQSSDPKRVSELEEEQVQYKNKK